MSNHQLDRSINNGGRHDPNSKMYGGMYFENNEIVMNLPTSGTYYPIGNGSVNHSKYISILPDPPFPGYTNPYWEISNPDSDVTLQRLLNSHGKNSTFTVHWGLSILLPPGESAVSNYGIRLTRVRGNPAVNSTVISTDQRFGLTTQEFVFPFWHSSITEVLPRDRFFIELTNLTEDDQDILVISSIIAFTQ